MEQLVRQMNDKGSSHLSSNVYQAPKSEVSQNEANPIDDIQESYESIEAYNSLKIMWLIRGAADVLISLSLSTFLYQIMFNTESGAIGEDAPILYVIVTIILLIHLAELYFIVQFFRRKKNSLVALHIFSALSLLNFPVGSALSTYHYIKASQMDWR